MIRDKKAEHTLHNNVCVLLDILLRWRRDKTGYFFNLFSLPTKKPPSKPSNIAAAQ